MFFLITCRQGALYGRLLVLYPHQCAREWQDFCLFYSGKRTFFALLFPFLCARIQGSRHRLKDTKKGMKYKRPIYIMTLREIVMDDTYMPIEVSYSRKDICSEGTHAIYFASKSAFGLFIGLIVLCSTIDERFNTAARLFRRPDPYSQR